MIFFANKKKEFLQAFIGKGIEDVDKMELSNDITAKKTVGTVAVMLGIRKELITLDELLLSKGKIEGIK